MKHCYQLTALSYCQLQETGRDGERQEVNTTLVCYPLGHGSDMTCCVCDIFHTQIHVSWFFSVDRRSCVGSEVNLTVCEIPWRFLSEELLSGWFMRSVPSRPFPLSVSPVITALLFTPLINLTQRPLGNPRGETEGCLVTLEKHESYSFERKAYDCTQLLKKER